MVEGEKRVLMNAKECKVDRAILGRDKGRTQIGTSEVGRIEGSWIG